MVLRRNRRIRLVNLVNLHNLAPINISGLLTISIPFGIGLKDILGARKVGIKIPIQIILNKFLFALCSIKLKMTGSF